jgi:hypothetical protein
MTFLNEPTICIYGEFGVRLEDHMVITETGARWFTQPEHMRHASEPPVGGDEFALHLDVRKALSNVD